MFRLLIEVDDVLSFFDINDLIGQQRSSNRAWHTCYDFTNSLRHYFYLKRTLALRSMYSPLYPATVVRRRAVKRDQPDARQHEP